MLSALLDNLYLILLIIQKICKLVFFTLFMREFRLIEHYEFLAKSHNKEQKQAQKLMSSYLLFMTSYSIKHNAKHV